MSVQTQIDRLQQNVANTYSALSDMGATMPSDQNSDNLAATARTVPQTGGGGGSVEGAVLYTEQTLTDEQKAQARANIDAVGSADLAEFSDELAPFLFYTPLATSAGSLQWNGDTSGRTTFTIEEFQFVHITDEVPVAIDLTAACTLWYLGMQVVGSACEAIALDSNGSYVLNATLLDMPVALVVSQDNTDIMGVPVAKKGVYFLYMELAPQMAMYTNALRFQFYSYSTPTQGGGNSVGSDTLTWDGQLSSESVVVDAGDANFVHVSDAVPTLSDFANGGSFTVAGETVEFDSESETFETMEFISSMFNGAIYGADFFYVVTPSGVGVDILGSVFPKAGVYFIVEDGEFCSKLTINGYKGFGGGGSSESTRTFKVYANVDDASAIYAYKTPDTSNPANRITMAELKDALESGMSIYLVFDVPGQSFFIGLCGATFTNNYGTLYFYMFSDGAHLAPKFYTAEYVQA